MRIRKSLQEWIGSLLEVCFEAEGPLLKIMFIVSLVVILVSLTLPWFKWYRETLCNLLDVESDSQGPIEVETSLFSQIELWSPGITQDVVVVEEDDYEIVVIARRAALLITAVCFILALVFLGRGIFQDGCVWQLLYVVVLGGFVPSCCWITWLSEFIDYMAEITFEPEGCAWHLLGWTGHGPALFGIGLIIELAAIATSVFKNIAD